MGKIHITLKTNFGEISIDGDSKGEVLALLKDALSLIKDIKTITPSEITTPTAIPAAAKKELDGIIEVTADGKPHITVPFEKLAAKDVIGILLYWKYPDGFSLRELTDLVNLNWKTMQPSYVTATIADMKGFVLKEGSRGNYVYKLSGAGKDWVENTLLPKLKE